MLAANFVRDDDINSYACLGAIEEDLIVASGVFGFLSASIGFLQSMSFATQKEKKECIRSCLRCVVAGPELGQINGKNLIEVNKLPCLAEGKKLALQKSTRLLAR